MSCCLIPETEYYRLQFLVDQGNEHLKEELEAIIAEPIEKKRIQRACEYRDIRLTACRQRKAVC